MNSLTIKKIFGAKGEFDKDLYPYASFEDCDKCYTKLLALGDPHDAKTYDEAKKKANLAVLYVKAVKGGAECKKYNMPIAVLVAAFVEKTERLWKLQKQLSEEKK